MSIITSLLDSDLYKFTMQQAVLHQFPGVDAEFKFKCRTPNTVWTPGQVELIEEEICYLCSLSFTEEELEYLGKLSYIKQDYIDFLRFFRLQEKYIEVSLTDKGELGIVIKGPWLHTILFEVSVLAIISEVYNNTLTGFANWVIGRKRLTEKIERIKNIEDFRLVEFGTRRRHSKELQDIVVKKLVNELGSPWFVGTSNVYLAKKYGVTPIGTQAHEFLQAGQALTRVRDSQRFMLQAWANEYRGLLGIALSDVVGINAFLRDFDLYFAKLYDGCRQDSGDPIDWGMKIYNHYTTFGIDPLSKMAVFSDSLTIDSAEIILDTFRGMLKPFFAIGTHLTNDVGIEPLNIVIKMVKCNGQPVAKISDSHGKGCCDDEQYLDYLKREFEIW
jgi:nicotinate phosphoribosyltransferase